LVSSNGSSNGSSNKQKTSSKVLVQSLKIGIWVLELGTCDLAALRRTECIEVRAKAVGAWNL